MSLLCSSSGRRGHVQRRAHAVLQQLSHDEGQDGRDISETSVAITLHCIISQGNAGHHPWQAAWGARGEAVLRKALHAHHGPPLQEVLAGVGDLLRRPAARLHSIAMRIDDADHLPLGMCTSHIVGEQQVATKSVQPELKMCMYPKQSKINNNNTDEKKKKDKKKPLTSLRSRKSSKNLFEKLSKFSSPRLSRSFRSFCMASEHSETMGNDETCMEMP